MSKEKTAANSPLELGATGSETKQQNNTPPARSSTDTRPVSGAERTAPDFPPDELAEGEALENEQAAMERLKSLLLESERASIEQMRADLAASRLDAGRLSQMLPLAIRKAASHNDKLAAALGPTMANSFHDSVKRDPKALADAISPIMGPAIRRAITQAISGMVQSLNQTIEHSFSWNGLKWRWQALTTNRPFAEVVLLNAFVYRVEQIFLIHRNDGLLLAHATTTKTAGASADLVSGMLTAIQDFVRDSFGASDQESIESMQVGDSHVWVIPSPHILLAAVIRGVPPKELRGKLQTELESIHAECSEHLTDYDGDNTAFEMAVPRLEACLLSQTRSLQSAKPPLFRRALLAAVLIVPLLLVGWLLLWGVHAAHTSRTLARVENSLQLPATTSFEYDAGQVVVSGRAKQAWIDRARGLPGLVSEIQSIDLEAVENSDQPWHDYLSALRDAPGIVVLESSVSDKEYFVSGLQDPLADDPQRLIDQFELVAAKVKAQFQPYHSSHLPFVMTRAKNGFPLSDSINWIIDDNRLTAEGSASHVWLVAAESYADSLNELIRVDLSQVFDRDVATLTAATIDLDGTTVLFDSDSSDVAESQQTVIEKLADDVIRIQQLAGRAMRPVDVILVGYLDQVADEQSTLKLARNRALRVWRSLETAGVRTEGLFVRQGGYFETADKNGDGRRCVVLIRLRDK